MAKTVEIGANTIHGGLDKAEALSGVARSGIERVRKAKAAIDKGGIGGAIDAGRQVGGIVSDLRSARSIARGP